MEEGRQQNAGYLNASAAAERLQRNVNREHFLCTDFLLAFWQAGPPPTGPSSDTQGSFRVLWFRLLGFSFSTPVHPLHAPACRVRTPLLWALCALNRSQGIW